MQIDLNLFVYINVMRSRLNGVVSFYDGATTLTQPFGGALYFEYILFNKYKCAIRKCRAGPVNLFMNNINKTNNSA